MMLPEETEVLAETCPGATSSNMRPTRTDLLSTADIPSEPSKPRLSSATAVQDLYLCLVYKTDVWLLGLHASVYTVVLLGGYGKL
jgi:hypothetical protein